MMILNAVLLSALLTASPLRSDDATQIGEQVVASYLQAMDDTAALLADRPEAARVRERFDSMRETHVRSLVTLGHRVAALDAGGRAQVRLAVSQINSRLQYDPTLKPRYEAYSGAVAHYFKTDPDFGRHLQTINILTQYAFFELLRQQAPEEAERLGISSPTSGEMR